MPQPLTNQQDGALELQIVDAERQRGGQNLDEELCSVLGLRRDKQAVLAYRAHFTLDPIQGAEGVREGGAQFGHSSQVSPRIPDGKGLLARFSSNPLV